MRTALATAATLLALALVACGGDDDDSDGGGETVAGPCSPVEEVKIGDFTHVQGELTAADYATNPPSWGDHSDAALAPGNYREPQPLGETVHLLEHGAVVGWTNGLSEEDLESVEDAFAEALEEGYYQLATVENPDMEVPFALSAWGVLQTCDEVDTAAIEAFITEWYASPNSVESALACQGSARGLPPC